jgi:D-sedoheptulose 7-phosphate isomerase
MQDPVMHSVEEAILAIQTLKQKSARDFIETTSSMIAQALQSKKKVLVAGNGGSLCDAMHFAEELTGYYREKRKALAAIALSDVGHMSCTSNDSGYEFVFSRAIEALGQEGDVFVALTTSGNSQNLILAVEKAKEMGIKTIAFLGKTGGKLKGFADLEWIVEGFTYSDRIQEAHMAAIHIIIERMEHKLFLNKKNPFAPLREKVVN